jgi:hypothetical protein
MGKKAAQSSAASSQQDAPAPAQGQSTGPDASTTQVPGPRSGQAPADSSTFSQLDELVKLHDRGALSDAEFSTAKARLLG